MRKITSGFNTMKVPLFECGEVVFCQNWHEWEILHRRLGVDGGMQFGNGASRSLSSQKGTLFIIGVFNNELSTLAHECAHIAFDICNRAGVVAEPGRANETFCHLVSRLVSFGVSKMKKPE